MEKIQALLEHRDTNQWANQYDGICSGILIFFIPSLKR